jgi:endonuclease/exonuclease/phosphatase family metal-dependent hydrolase
MYGGTYQVLAAQEIPSGDSAELLQSMLPGGASAWLVSFFDTTDTMDNGFWYRTGITLQDSFPLFVTNQRDVAGRIFTDQVKTTHPPVVAHFVVEDFDFTLVTIHLAFASGDVSETVAELRNVLDYLDWYFQQPDHDPDVVVCGDFNLPSILSGEAGAGRMTLDAVFDKDPRFQVGERRFAVTVHEPTTRNSAIAGGMPVNNYDHCVVSADTMEEFVEARRVSTDILTGNTDDPEVRLTSDHFPIAAFFRTRGDGIALDHKARIR